jgi:hypothetical protein
MTVITELAFTDQDGSCCLLASLLEGRSGVVPFRRWMSQVPCRIAADIPISPTSSRDVFKSPTTPKIKRLRSAEKSLKVMAR